jgi:endo-1,4-beta-xylanase
LNDWYSQCQPGGTTTTTGGGTQPSSTTPGGTTPTGTLDGKMRGKGRYFGTCSDSGLLSGSQHSNILKTEFGQLTPENSMKWESIEPSQNSFSYSGADALVNFAQANGKTVRGHTLVWHSQLPGWVSNINSASALTSAMNNHISNVAGRYQGKIYAWDVVNEVFEENGSFRNSGMRCNPEFGGAVC